MITCRELIDLLLDYGEGALSDAQRRAVEEHLAVCPPCVEYLRNYQQTIELGRSACADPRNAALEAQIPDSVANEILEKLRQSRE